MAEAKGILLVDDEPGILKLLGQTLREAGYSVSTASNGQEALAACRGQGFDLVITDLIMPNFGGRELCRRLLSEFTCSKIIVITGADRDHLHALVPDERELGAHCLLLKPFSAKELLSAVRQALGPP